MTFLCGALEGFYGRPWTQYQRLELFKLLQQQELNSFMYAPKDDRKHRTAWREPYDDTEAQRLTELITGGKEYGVDIIYAISPGLDITCSDDTELAHLFKKVDQVVDLGCSKFAILWDDIPDRLPAKDAEHFDTFAQAQAHVSNALFRHLHEKVGDSVVLLFCPTVYCGMMADHDVPNNKYLGIIGERLDPQIKVFWTGPDIISPAISVESIEELTKVIRRAPVIWDNLHANDYDIQRVYLGPYSGREPELVKHIQGILTNPNNEYEACYIAIHTLGTYAKAGLAGKSYDTAEATALAIENNWKDRFALPDGTASAVDIPLLCDMFYLPTVHGKQIQEYLSQWRTYLNTPTHTEREPLVEPLIKMSGRIRDVFESLCTIERRDLLYSLYPYVWEAKEEAELARDFVKFQHATGKDEFVAYRNGFFVPKINRGGFVKELRAALPFQSNGTFKDPATPNKYIIRPYRPEDEDAVYKVCLETGDSGNDGTHLFDDPKILGYRYCGPYINLFPETAFVLCDRHGVCGYTLGVVDSDVFWKRYTKEWIPKMQALYEKDFRPIDPGPNPSEAAMAKLTESQKIMHQFFYPTMDDSRKDIIQTYPAHLHIDLIARAQGQGLGTDMLATLLHALCGCGAKGVHLCQSIHNDRAYGFYTKKFGFKQLLRIESEGDLILGRTLTDFE